MGRLWQLSFSIPCGDSLIPGIEFMENVRLCMPVFHVFWVPTPRLKVYSSFSLPSSCFPELSGLFDDMVFFSFDLNLLECSDRHADPSPCWCATALETCFEKVKTTAWRSTLSRSFIFFSFLCSSFYANDLPKAHMEHTEANDRRSWITLNTHDAVLLYYW
jgi:hypothetical protein